MDGNKHIRVVVLARHPAAFGQRHVVVAVADHHRLHARLPVDARLHLAGDLQHHLFFQQIAGAQGARVLAAVARVDGDDHLARFAAVGLGFLDGFHRLRVAVEQIHHQPPAVRVHRFQQVGARAHRGAEVEHHPRLVLVLADADVLDRAVLVIQGAHVEGQIRVHQIHHHPVRVGQFVQGMLHRLGQIEDDTGVVRGPVQAHGIHGNRRAGADHRQQAGDQHGHSQSVAAHPSDTVISHRPIPASHIVPVSPRPG